MKNGTNTYQKIKTFKTSITKNTFNNRNNNIKFDNLRQYTEYEDDYPESLIKSKSLNKIKTKNEFNKKNIKLPSLKKKYINNNLETKQTNLLKKYLNKNNKKLRISTNNLNNISNFYSKNKNSNKLLSKHSGSSYNLKMSQNYIKTKNININKNTNLAVVRHLDRKVIKGNNSIMMPKHGYKLFTTTKIINNFNNQINQNKNKEIYEITNKQDENHNSEKKLDVLYEIEKKVSKIQNCFRKHLKEEETTNNENENNNNINDNTNNNINSCNNNIVDIISDISLSEEELNFSEEDSLINKEFSLEDEDL